MHLGFRAMSDAWEVTDVAAVRTLVELWNLFPVLAFPDLPKTIHVCAVGTADLAHPRVHNDFNHDVYVSELAQQLHDDTHSAGYFLVSLTQLLKSNRVHGVRFHTLDGACLLQLFRKQLALDPLQDVTLLLLCMMLLWLRRIGEKGKKCPQEAFLLLMCSQGKHRSMYVSRLIFLFLELLRLVLRVDIVVDFQWLGEARVLQSMRNVPGETRQHARCADDIGPGWLRRFAGYGPAKFVFLDCTDTLYYAHVTGEGRMKEFSVTSCLGQVKVPPLEHFGAMFHGHERLGVQLSMLLGGGDFLRSWLFFVRHGCASLWPAQCSLCADEPWVLQKSLCRWFHGLIHTLQREFKVTEAPRAPPPVVLKRKSWVDYGEDDSEEDIAAEPARPKQSVRSSEQTASSSASGSGAVAAGDTSMWTGTSSTAAGFPGPVAAGDTSMWTATSSVDPLSTTHPKRKPAKKVRFSDAVADVVPVERSELCWQLEIDVRRQALLSFRAVPFVDTCLLQVVDAHDKKLYIVAGEASEEVLTTADAVVAVEEVRTEIRRMQQLIVDQNLPFPLACNFASSLHEIQFYYFLQSLSVLVDGRVAIPFGLSAAYVTAVGQCLQKQHQLDIAELMARYLYVLYLSKPVDAEVWGKGCFGLMIPKGCLSAVVWWKNMQEVFRQQPDRGFGEEYCCTVGWPPEAPALEPCDVDFREELRVIEERFKHGCVRVVPELPEHEYWLYHDTCVPSEVGLLYPRVLPPLRPSAPLFSGTWGSNDGQPHEVKRSNMVKDTHVFLQVDSLTSTHKDRFGSCVEVVKAGACIPDDLFLEELLGNDLERKLHQAFRMSRLPAPWWLSSARGDVTHADESDQVPVPPPVPEESETADCLAAVQYQILGSLFMSSLRPDNVFHPHLRGHFEYHVGRLLAIEMYSRSTFRVAVIDFLAGCGVKFAAGEGWLQRVLGKRPRVVPTLHSLTLHTAWGDKCRAQRYCDPAEDRIWLVAVHCQQQDAKERQCDSHLEVCGCGTVCNSRHSLTERHGRQLLFTALQYLGRFDMDSRGKPMAGAEQSLGFVAKVLAALGYVVSGNEQYHKNPERRLQLFKQPRWYPRFYSKEKRAQKPNLTFESQPPCPDEPDFRCFSAAEREKIRMLERAQNIAHHMLEDMILGLKKPPSSRVRSRDT